MSTGQPRESAKIYEFPTKAGGSAGGRQVAGKRAESRSHPIAEVEFGSGWYHETAVQEAERARKPFP